MKSLLVSILFSLTSLFSHPAQLPSTESTTTYSSLIASLPPSSEGVTTPGVLTISLPSRYVLTNSIVPVSLKGGTGPYSVTTSGGNLLRVGQATAEVYLRAPTKEGETVLTVKDTTGTTEVTRILVVSRLTVPSSIVSLPLQSKYTISPSGGKAPYVYKVVQGDARLVGNVLTASSVQGKTRVVVKDTAGQEAYIDVLSINSSLTSSPSVSLPPVPTPSPSTIFPSPSVSSAIPGLCGIAHGGSFVDAPFTNLCTRGQATHVQGSGPWTWSCNGTGGGSTDFCSASKVAAVVPPIPTPVPTPVPDPTPIPTPVPTPVPDPTPIPTPVPTPVPDPTPSPTPIPIPTPTPVNGSCGSSHGQTFTTIPTANFCTQGSVSSISGSGPWTWSCNGSNGGSTAQCRAEVVVPPVPGPTPSVGLSILEKGWAGGNSSNIADWSPSRLFNDVVMGSRGFGLPNTYEPNLYHPVMDANGWPTSSSTLVLNVGSGNMTNGTYKGSFTGTGVMSLGGASISNLVKVNNTTTFDLVVSDGNNAIIANFNGPIQNLVITRPGINHASPPLFTQEALDYYKQFSSIRFMKMQAVEDNGAISIQTRSTPQSTHGGFYSAGVPLEYLVQLSNELYAQPGSNLKSVWFNIHHGSDVEYVTFTAQYIKDNLNPNLVAYIELSNEAWNWSYHDVSHYFLDNAVAEVARGGSNLAYDGDTNPNSYHIRYFARQTRDVALIFKQVFGQSAMNNRVRIVLPWQAGSTVWMANALSYLSDVFPSTPVSSYIFAISMAPYLYLTDASNKQLTTPTAVLQALRNDPDGGLISYMEQFKQWKDLAVAFNVHLVAYEGGPGIMQQDKMQIKYDAYQLDDMRQLVEDYFSAWWKRGGELFEYFNVAPGVQDTTSINSFWSVTSAFNVVSPRLQALKNTRTFTEPNPQEVIANNTIPGTVGGADTHTLYDKNPATTNNNHFQWVGSFKNFLYNTEPTGLEHWVMFSVYVREAGTYTMTPYMICSAATTFSVSIDNTVLSTIVAPKNSYPAGAPSVALTPVTVTIPSAGWHTFKVSTSANGGQQVGFSKFEFVKN